MKGSVDQVTSEGSVGWLYAEAHGRKPMVQAYLRHRLIGQAVADLYRPDLEQVGMGDGRHGFDIRFNEQVEPGHLPFVTIQPDGFDLTIPCHNGTGFLDLVRRVLADYPTTGRNRSVLGGLWTDRLDAAAVLAGRVAVGAVPAEAQTALADLVAHGHVVLQGAMAARPLSERELELIDFITSSPRDVDRVSPELRGALSVVTGFLYNDPLVQVLRSLFDDHPVGYRVDIVRGPQPGFAGTCMFENFPSPAECAVSYICGQADQSRVEIVRDSHELPEFSKNGLSRWTTQGNVDVQDFVLEQGSSIEARVLDPHDVLLVGPGLIHRLVVAAGAPIVRTLFAPKRTTPVRFLNGSTSWLESAHSSGARLRL